MAHAAIYVARGFEQQLSDSYLPVLRLNGRETLQQLWRTLGMYGTDVWVVGNLSKWTIRQLRAFRFIFVARRGQVILLRDGDAPIDIIFPANFPKDATSKDFETRVGIERVHLRKRFGNVLRTWALKFAVEFHGSEAETLMATNPRRHRVYGLPEAPPGIGVPTSATQPYPNDSHTDEKLVSMLDYMVYSCDVVYYIGCGDLRTILRFKHKDPIRFNRVTWICIDPIAPPSPAENVICHNVMFTNPQELRAYRKEGEQLEHCLIWDVRSDKGTKTGSEWDLITRTEDICGGYTAMYNRDWLALACVKCRIPTGTQGDFCVYTSFLVPQPSAPAMMYELRSIIKLGGFSHIERDHIPEGRELIVSHSSCCSLVQNFHGVMRGKQLKKALLEYIHIRRIDGVEHRSGVPRVDLFYLTNKRNKDNIVKINEVLKVSALATVWIGNETITGYDDFKFSTQVLMLRHSTEDRMVLDGNGLMLYLMWKGSLGTEPRMVSYDPSWAEKFGVVMRRPFGVDLVPDLSLCRFVGLRRLSSQYRINTDFVHKRADVLKRLGLDVSGHLFISLVSGAYCFDLTWWIRMIREWSVLSEADKLIALERFRADVIEWREESANTPWHKPEDLAAALALVQSMSLPAVKSSDFTRWLEMLR
ncbi:VP4 [CHeRI orbivirus 2-1]|nr:VP4 [CHeRI orbivirus 2-1]